MKNLALSRRISLGLLAVIGLLGCSPQGRQPGTLTLLTGQEADAWTIEPSAATVRVEMIEAGTRTTLAEVPAPQGENALGARPVLTLDGAGPEGAVSFEATAFDDQQNPVLHGQSSTVGLHGFDNVSLHVFLGRPGFARPLGALQSEHRHPLLTVWPNAFLFISGSDAAGSDPTLLDLFNTAAGSLVGNEPPFPQAAASSASAGLELLLIGSESSIWVNLASGISAAATAPAGLSFSELIGGQTFLGANGVQYLVGATRTTGDATNKVLRVNPDGTLKALTLGASRLAAAAGWVDGNLVVFGGSASGAGAEVLALDANGFAALDVPADAGQGAALAALSGTVLLLVGGGDPKSGPVSTLRTFDLACTSACTTTEVGTLERALDPVRAFPLSDNHVLIVGDAADGETHAFLVDASGESLVTVEQAFRERRAFASAALLPNGQVAVVGGDQPGSTAPVSSIELFFP